MMAAAGRSSRLDLVWAAAVGAAAFAVYVRTLAPGLVAVLDTPVFQFVGRVLGVPHNPGYPLYVLLTFPFSYLPLGSLAYRINLFSAVLGALTVSLLFLVARQLGCRRVVGAAASLGLAFGHVFWSQAIIAEVYTLASAIVAGVLLALLAWGHTGRPRYFFTAVALFAAGLGNHTTLVGFAPGIALYAVLKDRQFALRARTLAVTVLILMAGLLQYGFIMLRSRQAGAYVESRAATLGQLAGVVTGRQFSDRLFVFDWRTVVFDRLPWLTERILAVELTLPGMALAAIGAAWLLRRRLPEGLLFLLGCVSVVGFVLNYSVRDTPVFLIPAVLVLWAAAAAGAERLARLAEWRRWLATAVGAAMLALPAWLLERNFELTDRSAQIETAVTFDRLLEAVPDRTAFVREDFILDRMVMYKLLGERSGGNRHVELAPASATSLQEKLGAGFSVFAFRKSARLLRYEALNFAFEPVALVHGSLDEFLSRLPRGTTVALAVPGARAAQFAAARGVSFGAIGGPTGFSKGTRSSLAVVGVRGARREAILRQSGEDVHVVVDSGDVIGGARVNAAGGPVELLSNAVEASIRQGSRDLVRSSEGAVMAVWNANGELGQAFVMQAADGFLVPIVPSFLSAYALRGVWKGQELSRDDWTDVVGAARTGSTMLKVPAASSVVMFLGSVAPLAPRVIERSYATATTEITSFDGIARAGLGARLAEDGMESGTLLQAPYVYRLAVKAPERESGSVITALGGVPSHAVARVASGPPGAVATLYGVDTTGLLRRPDRASEVLLMARDDQAQLTGDGWSAVDWDAVSPYRWMTRTEARLLLPIAGPSARRIRIQALLEEGGRPTVVGLRFNGVELPSRAVRPGWRAYEWTVPGGRIEPVVNEAVITVDRMTPARGETPARGLAVTEVRVER